MLSVYFPPSVILFQNFTGYFPHSGIPFQNFTVFSPQWNIVPEFPRNYMLKHLKFIINYYLTCLRRSGLENWSCKPGIESLNLPRAIFIVIRVFSPQWNIIPEFHRVFPHSGILFQNFTVFFPTVEYCSRISPELHFEALKVYN